MCRWDSGSKIEHHIDREPAICESFQKIEVGRVAKERKLERQRNYVYQNYNNCGDIPMKIYKFLWVRIYDLFYVPVKSKFREGIDHPPSIGFSLVCKRKHMFSKIEFQRKIKL